MSVDDYERVCENCGDDLAVEGQVLCLECLETQTYPRRRPLLVSRPSTAGAEVNLVLATIRGHVGEPAPNRDDLLEALWVVEVARHEWLDDLDPAVASLLSSLEDAQEESTLAESVVSVLELLDVDDAQDAIVHAEAVLVRLLRLRGDA